MLDNDESPANNSGSKRHIKRGPRPIDNHKPLSKNHVVKDDMSCHVTIDDKMKDTSRDSRYNEENTTNGNPFYDSNGETLDDDANYDVTFESNDSGAVEGATKGGVTSRVHIDNSHDAIASNVWKEGQVNFVKLFSGYDDGLIDSHVTHRLTVPTHRPTLPTTHRPAMPTNSHFATTHRQNRTTQGRRSPTPRRTLPTIQQSVPTYQPTMLEQQQTMPMHPQTMPTQQQTILSQQQTAPTQQPAPLNQQTEPTHPFTMPRNRLTAPMHQVTMPTHFSTLSVPLLGLPLPTHPMVIPAPQAALPTHALAVPTQSLVQQPTHSLLMPVDRTLTTTSPPTWATGNEITIETQQNQLEKAWKRNQIGYVIGRTIFVPIVQGNLGHQGQCSLGHQGQCNHDCATKCHRGHNHDPREK